MSVIDTHLVCLWCLESDHDSRSCPIYCTMNPKIIWVQEMKLLVA